MFQCSTFSFPHFLCWVTQKADEALFRALRTMAEYIMEQKARKEKEKGRRRGWEKKKGEEE
jgi:hypothetical protein